ncbi:MAG TPA: hypothetical protein VG227_08845 [Caulobacteraceae bacterium]|jgi:hypothetical protein|nr:hypothetical protein [Caulobacteraceae bacterium]
MEDAPARRRGRLWLTIGEVAAVLAVVIAGLNYWDSHREHEAQAQRDAVQARQSNLASAIDLEGTVQSGGRRLGLKAVDSTQVIESQRYVFSREIVDHPIEITASAPGLDSVWLAPGLNRRLDGDHAPAEGRGHVPVAIVTAYLSRGEVRQDRSLYIIGYAWRRPFLHGREISLQGLAFRGRLSSGDPQAAVEKAWAAGR